MDYNTEDLLKHNIGKDVKDYVIDFWIKNN